MYLNKRRRHLRRHDPDSRMQLAFRFKALYQSLGMDLPACAKYLHVTERTLHNWMWAQSDTLKRMTSLLKQEMPRLMLKIMCSLAVSRTLTGVLM